MSSGGACKCRPRRVMVTKRNCNHSAFNGYHRQTSDYSEVACLHCGAIWRTKAKYVDSSPGAPHGWHHTHDPAKWCTMIRQQRRERMQRHGR